MLGPRRLDPIPFLRAISSNASSHGISLALVLKLSGIKTCCLAESLQATRGEKENPHQNIPSPALQFHLSHILCYKTICLSQDTDFCQYFR